MPACQLHCQNTCTDRGGVSVRAIFPLQGPQGELCTLVFFSFINMYELVLLLHVWHRARRKKFLLKWKEISAATKIMHIMHIPSCGKVFYSFLPIKEYIMTVYLCNQHIYIYIYKMGNKYPLLCMPKLHLVLLQPR